MWRLTRTATLCAGSVLPSRGTTHSILSGASRGFSNTTSPAAGYHPRGNASEPGRRPPAVSRGPTKDRLPSPLVNPKDPRRRLAVLIDAGNTLFLDPTQPPPSAPGEAAKEQDDAFSSKEREAEGLQPPGTGSDGRIAYPSLSPAVLEAIEKLGAPVLFRLFAHDLPPAWAPFSQPWMNRIFASAEGGAQRYFQFFQVEPFIPVPMQMEADAEHLFRFHQHNAVEGVCFLVKGEDQKEWKERITSVVSRWEAESLRREQQQQAYHAREETHTSLPSANAGAGSVFFNQYVLDEMGLISSLCLDGRSENGA
eukprot:gene1436-832_t